jgi:transposase
MTRSEIQSLYHAGPEAVITAVEQLLATVAEQQRVIAEQQAAILRLTAQVKQLQDRLATNSHNSSKPPSSDGLARKTKARREKSGKKPGGQPGHQGQTLTMVDDPDQTLAHLPERCAACQASLAAVPATEITRRQVFDLPPLALAVTEHQVGTRVCPGCGHPNRGEFPAWVTQPVQYGPRLLSFVVYLLIFQLVPYERVTELVADLWGTGLSEGTIYTAVQRCFAGLAATAEQIKAGIRAARWAGFDETGGRIAGKLQWCHTASTPLLTHLEWHPKRGREALEAIDLFPRLGGCALHDAWSPDLWYDGEHALCNAHHLRELTYLVERDGQAWAQGMIELLLSAKARGEAAREVGATALDPATVAAVAAEYQRLLAAGWAANPRGDPEAGAVAGKPRGRGKQSQAQNLLQRLGQYARETLAFVHDLEIPFDNNQAERDLRMIKVQQKVSGCFRSSAGADYYARIRSYISTMRKQGQPILFAIEQVFYGHPLVPQTSA